MEKKEVTDLFLAAAKAKEALRRAACNAAPNTASPRPPPNTGLSVGNSLLKKSMSIVDGNVLLFLYLCNLIC